ncbi:unnamed protein product [Rotaria socialis]|uniref:Ig-like domain-containing protein n=2 Tax=Rotaria socialis TaxID=392032 RepID=A0A818Y5H9_9BILA|nr:unnamed protein product [Rotaria socialis]
MMSLTINYFFAAQLMIMIHGLIAVVISNKFPQILTQSHNQTLNISDTAILTCHVENLGYHHVTWLKYDPTTTTYLPLTVSEHVFISDTRYFVSSYSTSSDSSYWNLEISNLKLSDEGIYECKISNRRASASIQINLQVQIPMTIKPSRLYVEPGSSVELDCIIYNINTSSITWHFSSLNHTDKLNIYHYDIYEKFYNDKNTSKSQLIIRHAQPYHSGLWTCTYKRQRRSAKIFVQKGALQHHQQQRLISNNRSSSSIQCTMSLILFALLVGHHMTHRI